VGARACPKLDARAHGPGGSEGEFYDLRHDPLQWRNLWDDPGYPKRKSDLVADLYDHLPRPREPRLPIEAPA